MVTAARGRRGFLGCDDRLEEERGDAFVARLGQMEAIDADRRHVEVAREVDDHRAFAAREPAQVRVVAIEDRSRERLDRAVDARAAASRGTRRRAGCAPPASSQSIDASATVAPRSPSAEMSLTPSSSSTASGFSFLIARTKRDTPSSACSPPDALIAHHRRLVRKYRSASIACSRPGYACADTSRINNVGAGDTCPPVRLSPNAMNFVIVSFGAGAGGVGGVGGGGGWGGGWGIGSHGRRHRRRGRLRRRSAAGPHRRRQHRHDDSPRDEARSGLQAQNIGAASGCRAATHSRNAIRMLESLMLDLLEAPSTVSLSPRSLSQRRPSLARQGESGAHSSNNEPDGRSESPTILSEKSAASATSTVRIDRMPHHARRRFGRRDALPVFFVGDGIVSLTCRHAFS